MKYIKEILEDRFRNNFIAMTIILFSMEMAFKLMNRFNVFTWSTLRIFISALIISLLFTSLSQLVKKRWIRNIINIFVVFLTSIYGLIQLGFINYLGVYISFNTSSQFGAVKSYLSDYLMSFEWYYLLIFIPLGVYILYIIYLTIKEEYKPLIINYRTVSVPFLLAILCFLYYGTISWGFMQNKYQSTSNAELFRYANNPSLAINQYGSTMFAVIDIKSYLFPSSREEQIFTQHQSSVVSTREVSEDLKIIANNETSSKYLNLHNYYLSQPVTDYNEYTGMFKDKNVVVVLMESVNDTIINEKYYPNFYSLYTGGWHWENNYSPRNSCATGNNEFSAMTGLYSIYNACTSNIYKNNEYFEAIFNLFNDAEYTTTSMHDFSEWYYERPSIHKNMGSGKFYNAKALDIKTATYYGEWPSDEEFFTKAFDILDNIEGKKMTWLTTVSSHQPYSSSSTYGDLYKSFFKEEGYSTSVARYMSKLKVLDNALGIMIDKLKKSGEWDDTVIVLLADHYPYGLSKSAVSETISYDLSEYEIERTPFVIYNSEMEAKTFSEYTSYINLVPTIANLMGIEYDPRIYAGSDLLSDEYESRVIFADGSWKNDIAYYNASTGSIKYYTDKTYTEEEVREMNETASLKISMSNSAIKNNYFKYLKNKMNDLDAQRKQEEIEKNKENLSTENKKED